MTLTRLSAAEIVPPMVSPFTYRWGFIDEGNAPAVPASGTYESANRGVWHPLSVPTICVAKRIWWANGATATGNIEAGIYLDAGQKPGAKLVTTGSVAQSGTSVIQFADITDTTLTPQLYWLYLSASSGSATIMRATFQLTAFLTFYKFQQASIGPGSAPSTATPAEAASNNVYSFGFSTHTTT